jgi:hypothetical protein
MTWYCPECGTEVTSGNECPECDYVDVEPEEENTGSSSGGLTSKLKTTAKIIVYLTVGFILISVLMVILAF